MLSVMNHIAKMMNTTIKRGGREPTYSSNVLIECVPSSNYVIMILYGGITILRFHDRACIKCSVM